MIDKRKELYQQTINHQIELGIEETFSNEENQNQEDIKYASQEILLILRKIYKEKILLNIRTSEGRVIHNNRLVHFTTDSFHISNSFILFAEGQFPEAVDIFFEEDGVEYSFKTRRLSNGNEKNVKCQLPSSIKILKRRSNYRIKLPKNLPVGLFWIENEKEFLGLVNDISDVGIGLKFDACYFNIEFYNILKNSNNKMVPILFNINQEHYAVAVVIKYIDKNDFEEVVIGAEFVFNDAESHAKVRDFVSTIRNETRIEKSRLLTSHIIKKAELES